MIKIIEVSIMALVRYTRPNYRHLSKSFNELMDEFLEPINARTTNILTPKVDIHENEQEFEFLLELPGVRKEDLQIELEQDVLYVSGERKVAEETKETNVHRMEQFYGSFHRSFHLPQGLDKENITAQYQNGILRLTIKKDEKAVKKQIIVQ
ncbi:MAG: Hsp20/alpha crystallin family protein [Bacteroidota bacterium]|nr:Hsp20/alpha crystallin family protein [Bacteroidota bacterium]